MKTDIEFYKSVLDNMYDGVYLVDSERRIVYWNRGAERITGFLSSDVVGSHCWDDILMHVDMKGNNLCTSGCPLVKVMTDGSEMTADVFLSHRDGHRIPVHVRATPMREGSGRVIGAVEIFSDNSEKMAALQMVEELQSKVFLDPLTDLANRRYVEMNLHLKTNEMYRYGWRYGLIMMDIDHFKEVNDGYGHDVGDEALKMISRTLIYSSRSTDLVGRWGGEEFIAIISNTNVERLKEIAERYRSLVERSSLPLADKNLEITISAGATLAHIDEPVESVIKRADILLYKSKEGGRNRVTTG